MKFSLNDKSKGFYWFPGDKFLNFILFFSRNLMLVCSWTSKSFSPDTLGVNFEVLNLHLYMDYCEFAIGDEAKGFSWLPGDKFLNFILFFQKLYLCVFVNLEKFKPW